MIVTLLKSSADWLLSFEISATTPTWQVILNDDHYYLVVGAPIFKHGTIGLN